MDQISPSLAVTPPPPDPNATSTLSPEIEPIDDVPIRRTSSRFQVDKVENDGDSAKEQNEEVDTADLFVTPGAVQRGVQFKFVAGKDETSDTQTSGNAGSYATANFKSFQNIQTIEKIPNVDHYRNILSMQGAIAARPTLEQLHDEQYKLGPRKSIDIHTQFERFSQIEVKIFFLVCL